MLENIWRIEDNPSWYSQHGHRVWTVLEVTFGVWPVASGHQAGVVWTVDGWQTARWTPAGWAQNVPNAYGGYDEIWRASLNAGATPGPVPFWYALYIQDSQGRRRWDNNGGWNYQHVV